jgi:uncharacterized protein YqfA (UPF0365 family)
VNGYVAIIAFTIGLYSLFFVLPVALWITARFSQVRVSLLELFVMKFLRKISPHGIVMPAITAAYAGVSLSVTDLQTHHMSGGNVSNVVAALIAAEKAGIELSWNTATCIDLAGRDVLEAVQMSVNPKVIRTNWIDAVAQDGIRVKTVVSITVRANIAKLIGSAGEDTVLARVGEGIVTAIGQSKSFSQVLEDPSLITKAVLNVGLDSGTAFEIISIDIADIEVGENIGAKLQIEQAEADKKVAQAKAEVRLSFARARQVEMRAEVEAMRAKVMESRVELPEALFEALTRGNCSVMAFYEMENLIADTSMLYGITERVA